MSCYVVGILKSTALLPNLSMPFGTFNVILAYVQRFLYISKERSPIMSKVLIWREPRWDSILTKQAVSKLLNDK